MSATIIQFPTRAGPPSASGIRIAYVPAWWCVERLIAGQVTERTRMNTKADAERIARRVARRDKLPLLPPAYPQTVGNHGPDAA